MNLFLTTSSTVDHLKQELLHVAQAVIEVPDIYRCCTLSMWTRGHSHNAGGGEKTIYALLLRVANVSHLISDVSSKRFIHGTYMFPCLSLSSEDPMVWEEAGSTMSSLKLEFAAPRRRRESV